MIILIRSYKINLYLKSSLFVLHRLKNYFILVRHFTFGIFSSSGQMRAIPRDYLVGKRFLFLTNRSLRVAGFEFGQYRKQSFMDIWDCNFVS